MKRRRRTAEEAREEILATAERLLVAEGPGAVRLESIAREMGVSHPTVLHHFGSMEGVLSALHQRVSRTIREDVLGLIGGEDGASLEAIDRALSALADPRKGRLLAWLVASGRDPFPPVEERGLGTIVDGLHRGSAETRSSTENVVLLAVFAMMGDALVGEAVRARLGSASESDPGAFRSWLLQLLAKALARGQGGEGA